MGALSGWLIHSLEHYGLLIVFITMAAESACIPIPSEVVVPYGGFLAANHHVALWSVVVVATVANVIGASIAYWVGRSGGRALFVRYGRYVLVSPHHLDRADDWFRRRGPLTVFFTRMMPGIRTFISLPAGIAKMPFRRFLVYTLLGSIPWNLALAYLGYAFGANWDKLQRQFGRYNTVFYVVVAVVVVGLIIWGILHVRSRARAGEQTPVVLTDVPAADAQPSRDEAGQ
jgi:membrane protein DedA with SNARE-associated domain